MVYVVEMKVVKRAIVSLGFEKEVDDLPIEQIN